MFRNNSSGGSIRFEANLQKSQQDRYCLVALGNSDRRHDRVVFANLAAGTKRQRGYFNDRPPIRYSFVGGGISICVFGSQLGLQNHHLDCCKERKWCTSYH